jgi:glycerophosphoryl diester phosphodiesterase
MTGPREKEMKKQRRRVMNSPLVAAFAFWLIAAAPLARGDTKDWNVRDHVPLDEFVIQCHGGAGKLEAENTIEAFELAWSLGTIPEADVRATSDGVIVAFHDADFKRVVRGIDPARQKQGVEDVSWETLRTFDVGSYREGGSADRRIPKLKDVFQAMTNHPKRRLYLDIKKVDLAELARQIVAARIESQVIFASTRYDLHRQWKKLVPQSGTLLWMGGTEAELAKRFTELRTAGFADITQLQIHVRPRPAEGGGGFLPSPEFLKKAGKELRSHRIVFQTLPWGSADRELYRELLDLGVASFATDYPTVTLEVVKEYYARKR